MPHCVLFLSIMTSASLNALALIGPTASGKTALALALAQTLPLEIISLDSALIYQGMDIGTAKPSLEERALVPHHLIDILPPTAAYSAADFVADCVRLVAEIRQRGKTALIVGGTMMYYQALSQGLSALPPAHPEIRAMLATQKEAEGLAALYQRLRMLDPTTAAKLHPTDSQRIERALEICLTTGQPMSELIRTSPRQASPLALTTIALIPEDRAHLHQVIEARFEAMLAQGFLAEVTTLLATYPSLNADYPALRAVGYRQAYEHLMGEIDYPAFVAQGIAATRQLAKRQLTWLRKLPADYTLNPQAQNSEALIHTLAPLLS